MNKTLFIALAVSFLAVNTARGQGTIAFGNRITGVLDAPIFDLGGTVMVEGPNAFAQLYVGGAAAGTPVAFRTGAGAGYWPTTAVTLPGVPAGSVVSVQVKAWRGDPGSTYETSGLILGESGILSVITGGAGSPPTLPAPLIGLTSWALVPEPSPLALGILAVSAFGFRRWVWVK